MELEVKHLTPYLPYGLKMLNEAHKALIESKGQIYQPSKLNSITIEGYLFIGKRESPIHISSNNWKPVLRPLSDISKELFIDGNFGFIPSSRLTNEYLHHSYWGENEIGLGITDKHRKMINLCFIGNEIVGECPFLIYQNLCEWHFYIFNLIGQGLAVDINTLS